MVEMPSLREMLDAGVHFGHKTSRWSPKMERYIFTAKSGVHVINLEKTAEKLNEALDFVKNEAAAGKKFIFVGTKKQSGEIIKEAALSSDMPYVSTRWLGGTLTNFEAIKAAVKKFKKQKEELENPESELTKSELSKIRKEVARGEKYLGGLIGLDKKPDVLLLFGSYDEKNAIREAQKETIKTVAVVDTNADPTEIDYPIPGNDDATKSIKLFAELFAKAINENKPAKEEASKK